MSSSTRAATSTSRTRTRASGSCGTRRNDAGQAGTLVFQSKEPAGERALRGMRRWVALVSATRLFPSSLVRGKSRALRRRVAVDVLVDAACVRTAIAAPSLGRVAELVRRRQDDTALVDVGR